MLLTTHNERLFQLGQVVCTAGVSAWGAMGANAVAIDLCLKRHTSGDWGEIDPADAEMNDKGVSGDDRLHSSYPKQGAKKGVYEGKTIWIITEQDRSATTILFPEEY